MTSASSKPLQSSFRDDGMAGTGIAIVVPCYRERSHILDVLAEIGPETQHIYVVDDACPEKTGEFVRENCTDERVEVLTNERNLGVGGATIAGYRKALDDGARYIVNESPW